MNNNIKLLLLILVILSPTQILGNKLVITGVVLPSFATTVHSPPTSLAAINSLINGVNQKTITQIGGLPIISITTTTATGTATGIATTTGGAAGTTTGAGATTTATTTGVGTGTTTGAGATTSGKTTTTTGAGAVTTSGSDMVKSSWGLLLLSLITLLVHSLLPQQQQQQQQLQRLLTILLFFYLITSSHALSGYMNCKLLNDQLNYKLYWTVNSSENAIYIGQEATLTNGAGWLGFGISPNGRMNGGGGDFYSDIVHGYPGCKNMSDMSTSVYNTPIMDAKQDITLIKQGNTGNTVSFEWKRSLNTGDATGDLPIDPSKPTLTIWAANDGTMPTGPTSFAFHTHKSNYGGEAITFSGSYACPGESTGEADFKLEVTGRLATFNQPQFVQALALQLGVDIARIVIKDIKEIEDVFCPECEIVDLNFPAYTVPAQPTTYVFRGFDLPPGPPKHIVRFEAIKNNIQVLHHIVLYLDPSGSELNNTYGYNQPPASKPIFAWAPGSDRFDLPEGVGFLVRNDTTNKHLIINMHYNNPTSITGLKDSSGIRIYLNTTRPNNAGFMWLGVGTQFPANSNTNPALPANALPPGQPHLHYASACPDLVTYSALQQTKKMNIFAYFNHMHLYGRVMWSDWIRTSTTTFQKTYIRKLGEILSYHYDEQKFVPLETHHVLQGGDALVTHCVFDTTSATGNIRGGEATDDEMCLQGIMYYPDYGFAGCSFNQTGYGNCPYPCNQSLTPYL